MKSSKLSGSKKITKKAVCMIVIAVLVLSTVSYNVYKKIHHKKWLEYYDKYYIGFLEKNNINEQETYSSEDRFGTVKYDNGVYKCLLEYTKPEPDSMHFGIVLDASGNTDHSIPLTVSFRDDLYYYYVNAYLTHSGKTAYYIALHEMQSPHGISYHTIAFKINSKGEVKLKNRGIPKLSDDDIRVIDELMPEIMKMKELIEKEILSL